MPPSAPGPTSRLRGIWPTALGRTLPEVMSFFRRDGGQSMVELALTMPLLVFALIGGADLARAFALQIAVENGSRAGAEAYAIDSTPTNLEAQTAVVNE